MKHTWKKKIELILNIFYKVLERFILITFYGTKSFLKSTQIMPPVQINGKGHTSCFYHRHFILTKCVIEKFVECFHLYRNRKLERKWSVRNEIRKLCRKRNKVAVKIAAYFTLSGRWSNGPATKSDRQLGQERAVNIDFSEWNHTCDHQIFLC